MLKDFLYKLPTAILRSFSGRNLLWHLLAIALTYVLVTSGFDWWYFESTRSAVFSSFGFPAALLGFFVPIMLPLVYLFGKTRKSISLKNTAAIVGQAAIVGWLISSLYKAFTGRLHPELTTYLSSTDISRTFDFGFFRNGIFWGWPSSHTTVAFAMAAALIALYPRHKKIVFSAAVYALYIGLGVSVTIHWFSDAVAGALIGSVIGFAVARNMRSMNG